MKPELQPWITAHHRRRTGYEAKPEYFDFRGAFLSDPTLEEAARGELSRLEGLDSSLGGNLDKRDHDMHLRRITLRDMIRQFEEVKNEWHGNSRP